MTSSVILCTKIVESRIATKVRRDVRVPGRAIWVVFTVTVLYGKFGIVARGQLFVETVTYQLSIDPDLNSHKILEDKITGAEVGMGLNTNVDL